MFKAFSLLFLWFMIAVRWMPEHQIYDKTTMVQAKGRKGTLVESMFHESSSMTPFGAIDDQWLNVTIRNNSVIK